MKAKFNFLPLAFFTSAAQYDQCPDGQFKEIAFVGASNAGKSSAINALSNNKKLAKISKTPGKTKLFNFFKCGKGYIVDFPGYGFSKVSKTQKKEWFKEIPQYFEKRENLEHVILFTDARHPMRDQDVGMAEMLFDLNIPFKIVLTKSDKLKDKDKQQLAKSFEEIYPEFMLFSIDDKESIASLGKFINGLLSN